MSFFPTVFVLHVRKGYEERATHIDSMMAKLAIPFEYILDGDKDDLDDATLDRYFTGTMHAVSGVTSCAYKHLLACEAIVARNLDGAFVMEDDIVLRPRFAEIALKSLEELPENIPSIISYEDTRLRFVPASVRRKGKVLYPGDRDRFAGCLYINAAGARAILEAARTVKMDRPVDVYHRFLLDRGKIAYWWTHPCVATQGSFNGRFVSLLSPDREKVVVWKLKRFWRRILYRFR